MSLFEALGATFVIIFIEKVLSVFRQISFPCIFQMCLHVGSSSFQINEHFLCWSWMTFIYTCASWLLWSLLWNILGLLRCMYITVLIMYMSYKLLSEQSKKSKKPGASPVRLQPAGVPSVTQHDDPRLVKSSQNPQRPFFPHATTRSVLTHSLLEMGGPCTNLWDFRISKRTD